MHDTLKWFLKPVTIVFNQPTYGWWDDGKRKSGSFMPHLRNGGYSGHENCQQHIEWGSWDLNFFIRLELPNGTTAYEIATKARKQFIQKLRRLCRTKFKIEKMDEQKI